MKSASNNTAGKKSGENTGLVPAVAISAEILSFLARCDSGKVSLTEICRAVGIYKSRGHAILKTLAAHGLVVRDEATKRYGLGPALLTLSRSLLRNLDIRQAALPHLDDLARGTGGTALLGLVSGKHLVVVAKKDGDTPLGITIEIGHRFPVTAGAHGKAIAAFLPEPERRKILKWKKLYFYGTPERYDAERLENELKACRERGYALDMGDLQPGIHAAAAPVFSGSGRVSGVLIVVGTFPREDAPSIGARVHEAASALSRAMGAHSTGLFDRAGDS